MVPGKRSATCEFPFPASSTTTEGQAVRVVPCILIVISLSLGATGCALFGKKTGSSNGSGRRWLFGTTAQQKKPSTPKDPLFESKVSNPPEVKGMLAGRVLDGRTNQPVQAYIRYTCLDDPQPKEAPVDAASRSDGYFNIYGLESGKHYKLVARAKKGNRTLAGTAYATAPCAVGLVIQVKEEYATSQTPNVPARPSYPKIQQDNSGKSNETQATGPEGQSSVKIRGFDLGQPHGLNDPPAPNNRNSAQTLPKRYPQNIIRTPPQGRQQLPPNQENETPSSLPKKSAVIPSCVVVGKQVINFALYDFYGQPWEWKKDRRGKLVLLDFWRTDCHYCLQDMTHLRVLQQTYGPVGLEVLGIASERTGKFEDQRRQVIKICRWKQTQHRMLLNSGSFQQTFLDRFDVRGYPTLILLDEQGNELWRHTGRLDNSSREALENYIRSRLGAP